MLRKIIMKVMLAHQVISLLGFKVSLNFSGRYNDNNTNITSYRTAFHQTQQHHHKHLFEHASDPSESVRITLNGSSYNNSTTSRFDEICAVVGDEQQKYVALTTFWYSFLAFITTSGLLISLISNIIIIYLFSR